MSDFVAHAQSQGFAGFAKSCLVLATPNLRVLSCPCHAKLARPVDTKMSGRRRACVGVHWNADSGLHKAIGGLARARTT